MNTTLTESEIRADRGGKIAAAIGFVLIVLLLLFPMFFYQNPPPGQPGILVNLGLIDTGQGEENAAAPTQPVPTPEPAPVAPATPPPPPTPTVTEPTPQPKEREVIVTEDPAAIALKKQKAREEAARQAERREAQRKADAERRRQQEEAAEQKRREDAARAAREAAEAAERKRQAEADALKGEVGGLFGNGSGRGETGKPGNQGVDNGDPNADRLSGISSSSGRVTGGLGGRNVLASPPVRENSQVSGTVVIEVCVNPQGQITKANYTQNGSSTADNSLVSAAIENAKRWRFVANEMAPAEQCGRISYNFKVQ